MEFQVQGKRRRFQVLRGSSSILSLQRECSSGMRAGRQVSFRHRDGPSGNLYDEDIHLQQGNE